MKGYTKEQLIEFKQWYDKLNPSDKVSFWSEDGSAKGLFNMSDKQIVEKWEARFDSAEARASARNDG